VKDARRAALWVPWSGLLGVAQWAERWVGQWEER
jgi:hypothetical protein